MIRHEIRITDAISAQINHGENEGPRDPRGQKALIPGYGKKGMGWVANPKKALYNKVYRKMTFSLFDLFK